VVRPLPRDGAAPPAAGDDAPGRAARALPRRRRRARRAIPALCGDPDRQGRRATAHAATEQDGFVWGYSTPDAAPATTPPRVPRLRGDGYTTIQQSFTVRGALFHALENALDVPHTAFLHAGLFRTSRPRREIDVVVRRFADRAEAEYVGEPRPAGLIGRQDRSILELQTETIRRFGGERLASTELDVLGPQIRHLMTAGARGEREPGGRPHEHRVRMAI
jgi:phenylpropionate dioxygenase-like ring-hydroxylating dioxygenase large terminal subunit